MHISQKNESKVNNTCPLVHLSKDGCSPSFQTQPETDKVKDSKAIAKQTKAEGNSLQEPKLETVSVLAKWNFKLKREQRKTKFTRLSAT